MSFKRIAVLSTVAVGALALVGGGYAAAQSGGSTTTLITSPAAGTPSQAYRGATTSELSQQGLAAIALAYGQECSVAGDGSRRVKITVTGNQGLATGTAKFFMPASGSGSSGTAQTDTVNNFSGSHVVTYDSNRKGRAVTVTYTPASGSPYASCEGETTVPQ